MNGSGRRTGAFLLLALALGLGAAGVGYWVKASAVPTGDADGEATRRARARAQQAIDALVREIEPHVAAAANIQELINALDSEVSDPATFQDLIDDEPWWDRMRKSFKVSAVVSGSTLLARRGALTQSLPGSPLVEAARQREVASRLVPDGVQLFVLGAALVGRAKEAGRDRPVVVLGRPADDKLLTESAARTGDGLGLASGGRLLGWAGAPERRAAVAALVGQEKAYEGDTAAALLAGGEKPALATALPLATGVWLWISYEGSTAAPVPPAAIGLFALGFVLAAAGAVSLTRGGRGKAGGLTSTYPPLAPSTSPGITPATARLETPPRPPVADRPPPGATGHGSEVARRRHQEVTVREGGVVGPLSTVGAPALARETPPYEMGRYRLIKLIGEGGMAEVYIATAHGAEGFERHFVVKRLHPHLTGRKEIVSQFIDEARMQARLLHSNIVSVFDFGRAGDEYFLALEYVHGRDLERVMQRHIQVVGSPLPLSVVCYAAHEVLEALAYAHNRGTTAGEPLGIVHRDVSPSNVLISYQGEVKLSDFGIVKADNRVSHTDVGVVKGNVSYMSPEQARGENVDLRSDLFSLGMLMFYCLTGRSFYASDAPVNQLMRAAVGPVTEQFSQLDSLPPIAQQILQRALARNPDDRYQNAVEFSRELVGFTSGARAELGELMRELYPEEIKQEF